MHTTPSRIAAALRFIANGINNSKEPSKSLVAADLRLVLLAMSGSARVADSNKALADILWNTEEGRDVEDAFGMARKSPHEDKLLPALRGLKNSIDDFARSLKGEKTTRQSIKEDEESGDVLTSAPPVRRK